MKARKPTRVGKRELGAAAALVAAVCFAVSDYADWWLPLLFIGTALLLLFEPQWRGA